MNVVTELAEGVFLIETPLENAERCRLVPQRSHSGGRTRAGFLIPCLVVVAIYLSCIYSMALVYQVLYLPQYWMSAVPAGCFLLAWFIPSVDSKLLRYIKRASLIFSVLLFVFVMVLSNTLHMRHVFAADYLKRSMRGIEDSQLDFSTPRFFREFTSYLPYGDYDGLKTVMGLDLDPGPVRNITVPLTLLSWPVIRDLDLDCAVSLLPTDALVPDDQFNIKLLCSRFYQAQALSGGRNDFTKVAISSLSSAALWELHQFREFRLSSPAGLASAPTMIPHVRTPLTKDAIDFISLPRAVAFPEIEVDSLNKSETQELLRTLELYPVKRIRFSNCDFSEEGSRFLGASTSELFLKYTYAMDKLPLEQSFFDATKQIQELHCKQITAEICKQIDQISSIPFVYTNDIESDALHSLQHCTVGQLWTDQLTDDLIVDLMDANTIEYLVVSRITAKYEKLVELLRNNQNMRIVSRDAPYPQAQMVGLSRYRFIFSPGL